MPEVSIDTLKKLLSYIYVLKARQEAAEAELKANGADMEGLQEKQKVILNKLRALPKSAWIQAHLGQVSDHDLESLLRSLESRP
jgi:hypothetical protein